MPTCERGKTKQNNKPQYSSPDSHRRRCRRRHLVRVRPLIHGGCLTFLCSTGDLADIDVRRRHRSRHPAAVVVYITYAPPNEPRRRKHTGGQTLSELDGKSIKFKHRAVVEQREIMRTLLRGLNAFSPFSPTDNKIDIYQALEQLIFLLLFIEFFFLIDHLI